MGFRETFATGLCILTTISLTQAMYLQPRIMGWNEDPCGPSLNALRAWGYPNLPPELPPNNTAGQNTNKPPLSPMSYYLMEGYDAPDLPDIPNMLPRRTAGGRPGTPGHPNAIAHTGGMAAVFPQECRCEFQCRFNGGRSDTKYTHQCDARQGLSCCCFPSENIF